MTSREIAVFALHALGASARSFDAVGAHLGDGIRLVPIDLPGFGDARDASGFTVGEMADHVLRVIRRDRAPRWVVLGHSMGGKVASVVARRALTGDDHVFGLAGVILLAGSPPVPEPMSDDKRAEMLGWVSDSPLSAAHAREFVDANTARPLPPELDDIAIADLRHTSPDAWRHWLEHGSREDLSEVVGVLDVPAVVVAGADDADLGADAQTRLASPVYPRARFVRLQGTGHLLPGERPAEVAAAIEELCAEIRLHSPAIPRAWAQLIASTRTAPRVRATLAARAVADDPRYAPRALTARQLDTLRALAGVVVPQPGAQTDPHGDSDGTIDLAARLDAQLAAGVGDGWRPADLPPDAQAARLALDALEDDVAADASRTVRDLIDGRAAPAGSALSPAQLQAWFEDVRVALTTLWLTHPASLAQTGYDVFATRGAPELLGFEVLRAGLRESWEPDDLGAEAPRATDDRTDDRTDEAEVHA